MKNRTSKKKTKLSGLLALLLVVAAMLVAYFNPELFGDEHPDDDTPPTTVEGEIRIHVIDVRQGDCILITTPDGNMLIDAGDNIERDEQSMKNYLDAQGITTLDYFVLTHPHADHIGGADVILENYTVKELIMPDKEATSKMYLALLDTIEEKEIPLTLAEPNMTFSLGDVVFKILGPQKSYSDTNDSSIVMRATYGSVSMMFTGDAEGNIQGESEKDILAAYSEKELQCDFLKVGHHGSDTSTSPAFLKAVAPKLAAIPVGEGNTYGHPVASILDALQAQGATVYRTDQEGHLLFVCDGDSIWYQK